MKKIYLIIIFTLISSCGYYDVYFNTFYNAKRYYTEAKTAKEKNNNKINSSIKKTFEKSIAKCAYVIKEYPKSKYADDALLLMGKCFFEQEHYLKALKKFQEIEQYYNESPSYPLTILYLARTYLKLKEIDEAKTQFNIIFNDDKFISYREQAYLYLSKYYLEEKDYTQAEVILQTLIEKKISKESYLNALFQYAQIEYQNEEYDNSLVTFNKLLSNSPPKRMRLDTRFYIGKIYMELNQYKKSKNQFKKLKKDEIINDKINEIDLNIGICYAYSGDTETAFSIFEKLINENKGKQIADIAYYHWGEIYFSLLKDYENAVEKFQKVKSEKIDKELMADALKKIKTANQFIAYKSKQNSDDLLELVESQFNIAEYYNLDLSLPDSAIAIYDRIINQLNILNCQLDSLNILYNNFIAESLKTNIQDSLSFIPDSLTAIPVSDTIKSDIDTLDTLSEKSNIKEEISKEPLSTQIENLKNNIEYYQNEIYPKALFLKTWILFNIKKDTLLAKEVVSRMENDIPESKYCFAAKRMLNNKPYELTTQYEFKSQSLFYKSMNYYNKSIGLEKSMSYLDTIITNYPESEIYPKALYAKAYLLIEELSDTTAAKPYLKELINEYPNIDLTTFIRTFFDGNNYIRESLSDTSRIVNTIPVDSLKIKEKE